MVKSKFADVAGSGEFYTYQYLWTAAGHLLKDNREDGIFYRNMMVMVLSALIIEAYLNHIGSFLFDDWSKKERKMSPKSKLQLIANTFKINIDYKNTPFSKFKEIFDYRHSIVHGKTIKSNKIVYDKDSIMPYKVLPHLEKVTTTINAKQYLSLSKEIAYFLDEHSTIDLPPIGLFGLSDVTSSSVGGRPPIKK